jgi:proteic killer suppression protein
MIISFKCKETNKIWKGERSARLPSNIQNIMRRKLRILNNAKRLEDLRIPPNNRLEELKGKRKGEHSIRVNNQWRVCFKWLDYNAYDVIIEDYH